MTTIAGSRTALLSALCVLFVVAAAGCSGATQPANACASDGGACLDGSAAGDGSTATTGEGGASQDGAIDAGASDADRCTIAAADFDQSCSVDTDCVTVTSTNYCEKNCLCGGSAINVADNARFNQEVAMTPLGSGALGAAACPCVASPGPCCRMGQCVVDCLSSTDGLSGCADAGGSCFLATQAACGTQGPPGSCAFPDEICCLP